MSLMTKAPRRAVVQRHPVQFRTSINMLDHLGLNMYSSVPKAIGEVVVNGYDADASLVTVTTTPTSIVVEDNGSGMNEAAIRDQFMILASGHKRLEKRTPLLRRLPIGAKGIGKLAGLGIARRIEVETWRDGTAYSFAIDRDELEKSERAGVVGEAMLDRARIALSAKRAPDLASGTRVTLTRRRPEARFDAKKVHEHLAQELPLSDQFKVIVDGKAVRKDEVKGRRIPIHHVDPVCGLIDGYLVVASKALSHSGVVTTVRGRGVGGPSFFDVDLANRRYHSTELIAGQVEVGGLDPDDGSPTAIKTDREGFLKSHPRYEAYAAFMTEQIKAVAKEIEDAADNRRDADRRAKLNEAVARATEVFNAYSEHLRRLQAAGVRSLSRGTRDDLNGDLVPHTVVNIPPQFPEAPPSEHVDHPPEDALDRPHVTEAIPVVFGSGRLRFKNQTFFVTIEPRGPDSPECEILKDVSRVVVNEQHPSYEEAVRNHWTEGVVIRAVATRFACDDQRSAGEAYMMLDDMLRFAVNYSKRRRGAAAIGDDEVDATLAPAF